MRIDILHDDFWNLRGSFTIDPLGLVDIETQCSLVRRPSGRFVLLDGYTLDAPTAQKVLEHTDGGRAIEAVLHLHPFHTIHVKSTAERFPNAKLYGTRRHKTKAPNLPWETIETDQPELGEHFDDFVFTVPHGVDFISSNENLHCSSVLAYHRPSRTLHVDDTLIWNPLPLVGGLKFHPTLKDTLEKRAGAAADFRAWAAELIALCKDVDHLALAHARAFPEAKLKETPAADHVAAALEKVEGVLAKHERTHG